MKRAGTFPVMLLACALFLLSAGISPISAQAGETISLDCGGIPLTMPSRMPEAPAGMFTRLKCSLLDRKQLARLRDSLPWTSLGAQSPPSDGWEYDAGMLFTLPGTESGYLYTLSSCLLRIDKEADRETRIPQINRLSSDYSPLGGDTVLLSGPDDLRFDSDRLKLEDVLDRAKALAQALGWGAGEPVGLAYCPGQDAPGFYWVRLSILLDGLPLHHRPVRTGFPGEGGHVPLRFEIAWGEDGLVRLTAPILSAFEATGSRGELISPERAAQILREKYEEQWLPDVQALAVGHMGLSWFAYSSTGNSNGGFTLRPVWSFEMEHSTLKGGETPFQALVCLDALDGRQIF